MPDTLESPLRRSSLSPPIPTKTNGTRRKRVRSKKLGPRPAHSPTEQPLLSSSPLPPSSSSSSAAAATGFLCTDVGPLGNLRSEGAKVTSDAPPKIQREHLVPSLDGIVAKRKQFRCICNDGARPGSEMQGFLSEDEIVGHIDGNDAEMQGDLIVKDGDIVDITVQTSEIQSHTLVRAEDGILVAHPDDAQIREHSRLKNLILGYKNGLGAAEIQLIPDGGDTSAQIQRYLTTPCADEIVVGAVDKEAVQIRGGILANHGVLQIPQASLAYENIADRDNDEIRGLVLKASADEVAPDDIVADGASDAQITPSADASVATVDTAENEGHVITSSADEIVAYVNGDLRFQAHIPAGDGHADAAQILQDDLLPGLDEMTALRCLAYVPLFDLCSLVQVTKRHRKLVRSGELLDLRWLYGNIDRWICIYTSGDYVWTAYNLKRNEWRNLPPAQVDPIFALSDRESLSAGTHLLWLGRECFNFACYKYDLVTNSWEPGPPMVNPRCLFASASDGKYAFVAGGFKAGGLQPTILQSAERYDSRAGKWELLAPMETPRQKCSGVFMDGKFYVIGGKDKDHNPLASGEVYDPVTDTWTTIPNMYIPQREAIPSFEPSPPLVAVANNQLYLIDSSTNLLKGYDKCSNTWKVLGPVPVRTDSYNGWGLAFKSLGDELVVIGSFQDSPSSREGVAVFSLRPQFNPTAPEWNSNAPLPPWKLVNLRVRGTGSFLYNCAVMSC